jgi:hypothetical protein
MTQHELQDAHLYGWGPPGAPGEIPVPDDVAQWYREFRPGYWGYVCPCCKCVWAPGWGEDLPKSFRAHVTPYLRGGGCFFEPKAEGKK